MTLPSNLWTTALRVSAAGSGHPSHHSSYTSTAEPLQHPAGHEQVHVLPNNSVSECAEASMSVPAPLAQGDSAVLGGEGRLMGGDIKAETQRNK